MDSGKPTPMDAAAKARIMSSAGKETGGQNEKGGWPARGQAAADKNANAGLMITSRHFPEIIATCQFTLVILGHFVSNRNPKN